MSAAGRSEETPDRVAATLRDAEFVRLVATADGDALAATGLLARALEAVEAPYQASLAAVPEPPATDADCTVAVGHSTGDVTLDAEPLSAAAADVVREIAADALDPALALAGVVAAGEAPAGWLLEAADLERRPGVALPTADPIEGLARSTLVSAGFSGDEAALERALESLEATDGRTLASFVALSAVEDAPPRAASAVERALHPYELDRFETLGGFADVLDAVAREQPGTGVALALGAAVETAALEAWRTHGQRVHAALRAADTGRYDGVYVARVQAEPAASLGAVARLLLAYHSPEPVAVAATDGAAAIAAEAPIETPVRTAATALDGRASAREKRATATFDGTSTDFVAAFREAL